MKKATIRVTSLILVIVLLVALVVIPVGADIVDIPDTSNAKYVALYNTNTARFIYNKNTNERLFPGSAVKMMTGLIACEKLCDRLDEWVTVTEDMLVSSQGSNIKLKAGMTVTVENLLYGVLCGGGNDASLVIANICGGSAEDFVRDMNAKAKELGMKNTYFTNPTGLDDEEMYSTISDIMTLATQVSKNALYLEISSAVSYVYKPAGYNEEIKFSNRNALLNVYSEYSNRYASGLIAGSTTLGGECAITYAERNGTGYICAVLNAEEIDGVMYSYKYINDLLEYAFENYSYVRIAEKGTRICALDTKLSMPSSDAVAWCVIDEDVYTLTHKDVDVENDLVYKHYLHNQQLNAPVDAGVIVGGVNIFYNDEIIGKAVLVTEQEIQASEMLLALDNLKNFFTSRFFLLSVIFIAVGLFVYSRVEFLYSGKTKSNRKRNTKRFY